MEKKTISILLASLFCIIIYVNFNSLLNIHLARFVYYSQYYLQVGLNIAFVWILFSNKIVRILTIPIGIYYAFHLFIQFSEIIDPSIKENLYRTDIINYGLVLGIGMSLFIIPIIDKINRK